MIRRSHSLIRVQMSKMWKRGCLPIFLDRQLILSESTNIDAGRKQDCTARLAVSGIWTLRMPNSILVLLSFTAVHEIDNIWSVEHEIVRIVGSTWIRHTSFSTVAAQIGLSESGFENALECQWTWKNPVTVQCTKLIISIALGFFSGADVGELATSKSQKIVTVVRGFHGMQLVQNNVWKGLPWKMREKKLIGGFLHNWSRSVPACTQSLQTGLRPYICPSQQASWKLTSHSWTWNIISVSGAWLNQQAGKVGRSKWMFRRHSGRNNPLWHFCYCILETCKKRRVSLPISLT